MNAGDIENNRKMFFLLSDLCKTVRWCRQDSVFCDNITFTQFFILDAIAKKDKLKMADLHRILAVDKSTTTRLLNPLVNQGLIRRDKSKSDQRAVDLTLKEKGRETHGRAWTCIEGFVQAINEGIPEERRAVLYEDLRLFAQAVRNAALNRCR